MIDYDKLEKSIVEAVLKVFGSQVVSIVLFRSYGRREAGKNSDIDLILVLEKLLSNRFRIP